MTGTPLLTPLEHLCIIFIELPGLFVGDLRILYQGINREQYELQFHLLGYMEFILMLFVIGLYFGRSYFDLGKIISCLDSGNAYFTRLMIYFKCLFRYGSR